MYARRPQDDPSHRGAIERGYKCSLAFELRAFVCCSRVWRRSFKMRESTGAVPINASSADVNQTSHATVPSCNCEISCPIHVGPEHICRFCQSRDRRCEMDDCRYAVEGGVQRWAIKQVSWLN